MELSPRDNNIDDHLDDTNRPAFNIIEENVINQPPFSSKCVPCRAIADNTRNNENYQQDSGEQFVQDGYTFNAEIVEKNVEVHDPIMINDEHSKGLAKWEMRFTIVFICLIFIGAIIGVTFLITIPNNNSSGNLNEIPNVFSRNPSTPSPITNPPSPSPTFNPLLLQQCFNSTSHQSSFYTRIRDSIIASTHVPNKVLAIDTPQTPQHKSLCWMSLVDESALAGDPLIERFSLVTLYYEWVSEDKKNVLLNNWLTGEDHCEWEGVGCKVSDSEIDTVSLLEFVKMDLEGSIPPEIGNLRGLEKLRLESSLINGPIPSEIKILQDLRTLVMAHNKFMDSSESLFLSIFDLPLVHLDLQNNGLVGLIPNEFERLSRLEVLKLGGNDFTGPTPPSIGNLVNLEFLNLANNKLAGPIPSTFRQLTSLEYLSLPNNFINGTLPTFLGSLTNLGILSIALNNFKSTIPTELGSLTNIEQLDFKFNYLFGVIPSSLGNLINAEEIVLRGNDLVGDMPQEICNMTQGKLRRLDSDCFEVHCSCCSYCW